MELLAPVVVVALVSLADLEVAHYLLLADVLPVTAELGVSVGLVVVLGQWHN